MLSHIQYIRKQSSHYCSTCSHSCFAFLTWRRLGMKPCQKYHRETDALPRTVHFKSVVLFLFLYLFAQFLTWRRLGMSPARSSATAPDAIRNLQQALGPGSEPASPLSGAQGQHLPRVQHLVPRKSCAGLNFLLHASWNRHRGAAQRERRTEETYLETQLEA